MVKVSFSYSCISFFIIPKSNSNIACTLYKLICVPVDVHWHDKVK